MTGLFIDHVWQSTLVAALAGVLALSLRRTNARARYWIWLAASIKFLVPFAVLVAAGERLATIVPSGMPRLEVAIRMDTITMPLYRAEPAAAVLPPWSPARAAVSPVRAAPIAGAIWLSGSVLLLMAWAMRWRRVAAVVSAGRAVESGRVHGTLRRLERSRGAPGRLPIVVSATTFEPGVFGIVRPVLLWPEALDEQLTDSQVEAIVAHELVHVRYRDNLAAAAHALVQSAFWFNPVVWWVGNRLLHERERACDETVITSGSDRQVYAESILRTCRFSVQAPATCLAGVTGSDLKRRIEAIMTAGAGQRLHVLTKGLLWIAAVATLGLPVATGVLHPPRLHALSLQNAALAFEVASVKPNKSGDGRIMIGMQPGGRFTATNVPLRALIRQAYQLQDFQIVGAPDWINNERFDIIAKAEGDLPPAPPGTAGPMQLMMRNLLGERFKLVTHQESREMPIYALVLARNDGKLGEKLQPSKVDCAARAAAARGRLGGAIPQPGERPECGIRIGPGTMAMGGFPLSQFAQTISQFAQRIVVDKTGLSGPYDLDLTWTPDQRPQGPPPPGAPPLPPVDPDGPSIFTAVQEQLGLKLDPQRGPVEVLVVDSVDRPTPD